MHNLVFLQKDIHFKKDLFEIIQFFHFNFPCFFTANILINYIQIIENQNNTY